MLFIAAGRFYRCTVVSKLTATNTQREGDISILISEEQCMESLRCL